MAFIHVYMNNPTAGGTDGVLVSEGTEANPITVGPLNATENEESAPIKLALRCETGYKTSGTVTVQPVGTKADKWALAPDVAGAPGTWQAYGAALTIEDVISDTNYVFWAKARATSDEPPQNDTSVDIQVQAMIVAA
ncbi:hypothetical protein Desku_1097 [Desulfofundulus kuznetsovii DSM 6115]|uniref:Uncharacterized protein n=1 Tax=Desulfofundulus kuznetsovii (strain DSM 6115 / VKM B-1805 / 17) TaxID=760568 RepID=A0AAU8P8R8_DESK7|nr:hypothetical protein Desku_1097 [Desulfofundulus kuznetsovii DSM 6115]